MPILLVGLLLFRSRIGSLCLVCLTRPCFEELNLFYLVYAYLQMGNNKKALEQLNEMKAVTNVFPKNHFASSYALTAIPVRMALENKNWEKATNLELPEIDFPWEKLYWEKAMLHFGKALGYSNTGNIKSAENDPVALKDCDALAINFSNLSLSKGKLSHFS